MSAPVYELRDLAVAFDGERVIAGVTTTIASGDVVALLGENGSGKTTLVRALLGLVPAAAGEIRAFGIPIDAFRDWRRVAYVPQRLLSSGAVPVSVEEVVGTSSVTPGLRHRRGRDEIRRAVNDALESVGLSSRRHDRMDSLSGGQQRRVLIAAALAKGADVFLLDEPTAGVDAETHERIADTFRVLKDAGRTVVLVTHELGAFSDLATRVIVLGRGASRSVRYDGPPPVPDSLREHVWHHSDELVPEQSTAPLMET